MIRKKTNTECWDLHTCARVAAFCIAYSFSEFPSDFGQLGPAAYVILLRNMMDMRESMSPKPVTGNTLFYDDNFCSAIVVPKGRSR